MEVVDIRDGVVVVHVEHVVVHVVVHIGDGVVLKDCSQHKPCLGIVPEHNPCTDKDHIILLPHIARVINIFVCCHHHHFVVCGFLFLVLLEWQKSSWDFMVTQATENNH